MNSQTLALFKLPRLLPGKGVQLRGYGDQKTLNGLAATGIGNSRVIQKTNLAQGLNLSELQNLLPFLRPGAGVRLHGHDGLLVLERLPDVIEEAAQEVTPIARLLVAVEGRKITAFACVFTAESIENPGNFVISQTTTTHYANGDVIYTSAASGVINTFEPGETPAECAALENTTDYDPEFDYGAFVSDEVTEETMPFDDLFAAAMSAFATASVETATQSYEWLPDTWSTISAEGGFADDIDDPYNPGNFGPSGHRWNGDAPTYSEVFVTSTRWRATNTGTCSMIITWQRVTIFGATVLTTDTITLAPGETSDWIGPPTIPTAPDADDASYYRITRVQLNGL